MDLSSVLMIVASVALFFVFVRYEKGKAVDLGEPVVIRLPRVYMWLGIISLPVFLFLFVFFLLPPAELWGALFILILIVFSGVLVIAGVNWRITLHRDGFTYRNLVRKTYKIDYVDVESIKSTDNSVFIKTGARSFYFDSGAVGIEKLVGKIEERVNRKPPDCS